MSGLRLDLSRKISSVVAARVSLDPFGVPSKSLANHPGIADTMQDYGNSGQAVLISDYALTWQFRPRLALGIEEHGGTTRLPALSGLSLASMFQYAGWNQAALVANYDLALLGGTQVRIAIGNGEGERYTNLDPQHYGGLEIRGTIITGLGYKLGMSFDGNNVGSSAWEWEFGDAWGDAARPRVGFSTQRVAAAVFLNGQMDGLRGLLFSVGMQITDSRDLDKEAASVPDGFYAGRSDKSVVRDLTMENASSPTANRVETTVLDINTSLKLFGKHFIGLGFETQTVNSGDSGFLLDDGSAPKELRRSAWCAGAGLELDTGLVLTLEYREESFDRVYTAFHYRGEGGEPTKNRELFNSRLAWNW